MQQVFEIECPYFGTDAGSPYACTIPNGLRWPFAALSGRGGLSLRGQAMGNLRQRRVPFGVCAKRRKFWLMAASALAPLSLGVSEPALAQCAGPPGNTVCTPGGNPYPSGINVNTDNGLGGTAINLQLLSGVNVTIPAGSPGVNAVNAANTTGVTLGSANISITANGVTINNTANPGGNNQTGLRIQSSGDAIITATNTTIDVNGTASDFPILAFAMPNLTGLPHVASVTWSGPQLTTGTTVFGGGTESGGIQADNRGIGNASIVASGNITGTPGVSGAGFYGLIAHSGDSLLAPSGAGDASVTYHSGTINVFGNRPRGVVVWGEGDGSATVTTDPGTVIIVNGTNNPGVDPPTLPVKAGVAVQLDSATAANGRSLTATVASTIINLGSATPDTNIFNNPVGIRTISYVDAPTTVNYTGPGITTQGGGGAGIQALSGGGSITVNAFGPIDTTNGSNAVGILADSGTILAQKVGLLTDTTTIRQGIVVPTSTTGSVQVNATNVSTLGQFGTGISATAGIGGVTVNIASGGSVMGGWQADLTSVGPIYGLQATGVFLSSVAGSTLTNNGSIGALSDRAVAGDPQVINNGTITGFVQFTGGDNSIINNNTFNLRHFADTDGDAARDTLRVAIADLGDGPNNSFTNNGTLRLLAVTGATTLDSTGQYLPLGNPNNAMALGGPLQGHLVGVATFTNSGTIDLQSNPVAGDVLVITGARQAGVAGPGTFISNGGTLRLDTVLNEGGVATRSDTLVVDGTLVGAGATNTVIRNAGGAGALTVADGILVVEVKDPARSAPGAFTLNGGLISAGAFDYFLFKGGFSPGSQGNWYLRNVLRPTPEPEPTPTPLPTPVPGAPPIPLFNPEVPLKSVVPSVARSLGLVTLGTFNERQGDQLLVRGDTKIGAWGRVFGQQTREHFAQGARPDFDGTFAGFQAGADLWRFESINGHSDHIGFYVAQARATGSVHGLVDAFEGASAGHLNLDASSYAGYWTHLGPSNWYIDAVLQGTHYYTSAQSIRSISNNFTGNGFAASIEAGYPIMLASWIAFEPQIQGIWQRVSFDNTANPFSTITFDRADVFTGRAGALLRGTFGSAGMQWQPYLKGNVWWGSNGFDTVRFNDFAIQTGRNGGTALEGGGGVTGKLTRNVSVYGDASYLSSLSGESRIALKGNVGLRVTW
jgi:outer membrane autotransporter protein